MTTEQRDPVLQWASEARAASAAVGGVVSPAVLLGLVSVESGGREGLTSSANAGGLTQFIPGTATAYNVDVRPGHATSQLNGAARYLRDLLREHKGDLSAALNAYNGAQTINGKPNPYASNVLDAAGRYGSVPTPAPGPGGDRSAGVGTKSSDPLAGKGLTLGRAFLTIALALAGAAAMYVGGARALGLGGAKAAA